MKLFWKIFAAVYAFFSIVIGLAAYVSMAVEVANEERRIVDENRIVARLTAHEIEHRYRESQWPFEGLNNLSKREGFLFWWVVNGNGRIHLADKASFMMGGAYDYFPAMGKAKIEEGVFPAFKENYGIVVSPLQMGNEKWSFWLGFSTTEIVEIKRRYFLIALLASVSSLLILGLVLYRTVRYFLRPVTELAAATTVVGSGDLSHRVAIRSADELGRLADAFNRMTGDLQRTTVSKEYLDSIIETMLDALIVLDGDSRIVMTNRAACELLGLEREELIGAPSEEILRGAAPPGEKLLDLIREGRVLNHEMDYRIRDGKSVFILLSGSVLRDERTDAVYGICMARDISARREMEEELRRKEKQLSEAMRIARIGAWEWEIASNRSLRSREVYRIYGVNPEQFDADPYGAFLNCIYPEDRNLIEEAIHQAVGYGKPFIVEFHVIRPDGEMRKIHSEGEVVCDEEGRPFKVIGFDQDITERKRADDALRESEKRFRELVENSLTGIFIIQEGRVAYYNPEQQKFFGALLGDDNTIDYDAIYTEERVEFQQIYRDLLSGRLRTAELDFRFHATGKNAGQIRWAYGRASIIEYRGREAILFNLMDITRLKELEHLVKIQDKMSSLGRVAAGIAHELRNPLSGLNIYLSNLEKALHAHPLLESQEMEHVGKIIVQLKSISNRIEGVVKKVMDFSRPSIARLALVDLNQSVEEAVELCTVTLRKSGITLDKSLARDLPKCYADPGQIEQVILNLVTNAIQIMKDMGGPGKIGISSASVDNLLIIKVVDSGPGVPLPLREKIFDPFFTTRKEGGGIGLSISHRIITDHGGTLHVSTSEWGGADFTIEIPVDKRKVGERKK